MQKYIGYLVINKRKQSGELHFCENKIAFICNGNTIVEWNKIFYSDVEVSVKGVKVRKIIFSKDYKCLILSCDDRNITFLNDEQRYFEIKQTLEKMLNREEESISEERKRYDEVVQHFEVLSELKNKTSNFLYKYNGYKKGIEKLIDKIKDKDVLDTLGQISIEQINSNKEGIKILAFKNAGINNIKDLLSMMRGNARNIKGIGEYTIDIAYTNALGIMKAASENWKLRLTVDNKDDVHTELIENLFFLKNNEERCNLINDINTEYLSKFNDLHIYKTLINDFKTWFFLSESEKVKLYDKAISINEFFYSEEAKVLNSELVIYESFDKIDKDTCWKDFEKNTAPYYAWLEQFAGNDKLGAINEVGLSDSLFTSINKQSISNELLKVKLRSYQIFGVKYILYQKKVLLGDEMGLGKTIQAIATIANLMDVGKKRFLVVCPLSVLINWCREIEKHSTINGIKIYGSDWQECFNKWQAEGGVSITTYEMLSKLESMDMSIDMIIVDEAHYVKNPGANRTKNLLKISNRAEYRLFMTGTPLENKVEEMKFLISCLQPEIVKILENVKELVGVSQFKEIIAPVYLRRTRKDVLKELPEKIEVEEWGNFNNIEMEAYIRSVHSGNFMGMRRLSWNVENMSDSTKAARLIEICNEARDEGRKIVVFSYFREVLEKVRACLGDRALQPITGDVSSNERQKLLDEFEKAEPGKVLISQIVAGGVGLNIQCASVVILCEPQLKPSTENQAISRVYRMGQAHTVMVHRLLIQDSVDERIMGLLKQKQDLFDEYADESIAAQGEETILNNKMINQIISEEKQRLAI